MLLPRCEMFTWPFTVYSNYVVVRETLLVAQRSHFMCVLSLQVPWCWCVSLSLSLLSVLTWLSLIPVVGVPLYRWLGWCWLRQNWLPRTICRLCNAFLVCDSSPWVCAGWEGDPVPQALVQCEWVRLGDEQLEPIGTLHGPLVPCPVRPCLPRKRCQVQAELSRGMH